jgi:hypothetical protein
MARMAEIFLWTVLDITVGATAASAAPTPFECTLDQTAGTVQLRRA